LPFAGAPGGRWPLPFCSGAPGLLQSLSRGCGPAFGRRQLDLGAFLQLVCTVGYDDIAWRDAARDRRSLALNRPELHGGHRHRLIVLDDVDEGSRRAALDRRRRHESRVGKGLHEHSHVDELIGEEREIRVRKFRAKLHGAGRGVDLVIDGDQLARRELRLLIAVPCLDGDRFAVPEALKHLLDVVLGNRIDHGDRLELGDHDEAVRVRSVDDVSRIDLPQSDAAGDRRGNPRIRQLQLRVVDCRLVSDQRGFHLAHQRLLRVDLLLRDRVLCEQCPITLKVDLRIAEQRLVLRHLALRLLEHHLEGARIDLGEHVAGFDDLSFGERDPHQLPIHAGPHGDRIARRHRAECIEVDVDAPLTGGHRNDRRRARRGVAAAPFPRRRFSASRRPVPDAGDCGDEEHDRDEP